jgi:N-acyl-D-aspartate/D-glutamate deacylase
MKQLVRVEMDAGALGLSTGLEYDPGIYSQVVFDDGNPTGRYAGRPLRRERTSR